MNILQLELTAFGPFTDTRLDFSPPGFHIIYGVNEAGKSSARRALMHLLFGIPERTTDTFLHPNEQLRIGGRFLNGEAQQLLCYRRKGRKNTLLDADNKPLAESCLHDFLGPITETQFQALFCFDHEQLRQGGEDLLNGGGEVGESLFAAGTGSLRVHEVLAQLDKEAEELFKARGSKPLLNQTIKSYKDACKRIKEHSLSADKWREHATLLEQTRQQHQQLTTQLQQLRAEQHRLARIQRTRPLLQRREQLKDELLQLTEVVILPDDAMNQHFEVITRLRMAQAQEKQTLLDIAQLQQHCQHIQINEAFLAHKEQIDALRGRLGSHQKAERDLPGVRTEMRTIESEAQNILKRIYPHSTLETIQQLTLTEPQREQIKKLADSWPVLQEKQRNSADQLAALKAQSQQAEDTLATLDHPPNLTELQAVLTRVLKHSDLETTLAQTQQQVHTLTTQAEISLKQMGLWHQGLEALETAALPSAERIEHFERRFQELEHDRQRIKERLLEARQHYQQATEKLTALRWHGEVPTEAALMEVRQQRQHYWQQLKHVAPQMSFEYSIEEHYQRFEHSMYQADELADRLRREAHRVAEYAMLVAEQQQAQQEQSQQAKKWHLTEELLNKLHQEWQECWKPLAINPWSPVEMRTWLTECMHVRQQVSLIRQQHQKLQAQQHLLTELQQELTQALTQLQPSPLVPEPLLTRLADLMVQAQNCVAQVNQLQQQRHDLEQYIQQTTQAIQRLSQTQQQLTLELDDWQQAWAQALVPLQLPSETPTETARTVLTLLDQVLNKIDRANSLRRRVTLMERDAQHFQDDVSVLVQRLAPQWAQASVEHRVSALVSQLNQTAQDLTRLEQLQQRLHAEQQRQSQVQHQLQAAQAQLQALLEQAHCHDVTELEAAELASLHKKELQRELADVEQQLLEQGEGLSLAELAATAHEVDIDQLPSQLQNYAEDIQKLEYERSELDQRIGELRILLKQMDGNASAAQAADEAQLALAEMQNLSERYMQVHLAASVLRKSIERYREQHQGPVIKRASSLFSRLTLNQFKGLKVDYHPQTDQPILLGLRQTMAVPTAGMSEGTRDQLYLALRLASIEHYFQKNTPLPLILDDVLINFDDQRAQAALKIFSELKTQILLFTHHSRLVELAQQVVPQVLIHEL